MTPTVYTVSEGGFSVLAVRTYGAPEALIEPVRKALASLDPALPFTADWNMWLRMALLFDVAYLARPLVKYRWHSSNETLRFQTNVEELVDVSGLPRLVVLEELRRMLVRGIVTVARAKR